MDGDGGGGEVRWEGESCEGERWEETEVGQLRSGTEERECEHHRKLGEVAGCPVDRRKRAKKRGMIMDGGVQREYKSEEKGLGWMDA